MQEYTVKRRCFVFEGNEVLRFFSSVPKFEDHTQIEGFYSELSGLCEKWCEEVKFPELCERLKSERRAGRGAPRRMLYRFDAKVIKRSEQRAEVHIEVSLSESAREPAVQYRDAQIWDLASENLCGVPRVPPADHRRNSP